MSSVPLVDRPLPAPHVSAKVYFWQRRRFWIGSFLLVVIADVGSVACLPTTRDLVQFHRIKAEMTEQAVVDLLGPPTARSDYNVPHPVAGDGSRFWIIGELVFAVNFRDGKAVGKIMSSDLAIARWFFAGLLGRNLL